MADRPDFVIIGAMKCATTTLHDQLARQPGVFMSMPKEPNFFSDDEQWGRGRDWYASLFADAPPGALCGESSTHYTKLPSYPNTIERFAAALPNAKLIYIMRDPIDRLVSQYIHEWSMRNIAEPIDDAVRVHPELSAYSCYATQLRPWLDRFGHSRVLPVFFERLTRDPQGEFERVCRFIGLDGSPVWHTDAGPKNVSAQRSQRNPVRDRLLAVGVLKTLRRTLLPESFRDKIKSRWRMEDRPELSESCLARLQEQLDPEMETLGRLLGIELSCAAFKDCVLAAENAPEWVHAEVNA